VAYSWEADDTFVHVTKSASTLWPLAGKKIIHCAGSFGAKFD
jgi:hypothetical protein